MLNIIRLLVLGLFLFVITSNSIAQCPVDAGDNYDVCCDSAYLNADDVSIYGSSGVWTVVSGTGTFTDDTHYITYAKGLSRGENIFRWTIDGGTCYDDVIITNNLPTLPNAGSDQVLCTDSTILDAIDPEIGIGYWSIVQGSGTFSEHTLHNTSISGLAKGENIIRWTIENKGCTFSDDVVITNGLPSVADAGEDQVLCIDSTVLEAKNPNIGIGSWAIVAGSAYFSDHTEFKTSVSGLSEGDNIFIWTIYNMGCVTEDMVIITVNKISTVDAGQNQHLCDNKTTLSGSDIPSGATGNWSVKSGAATFFDAGNPTATVTDLGQGDNWLYWTFSKYGCQSRDSVRITNSLPDVPDAGEDLSICDNEVQLSGNKLVK